MIIEIDNLHINTKMIRSLGRVLVFQDNGIEQTSYRFSIHFNAGTVIEVVRDNKGEAIELNEKTLGGME